VALLTAYIFMFTFLPPKMPKKHDASNWRARLHHLFFRVLQTTYSFVIVAILQFI
jgi:hypothetical protein